MADLNSMRDRLVALEARVQRTEALLGQLLETPMVAVFQKIQDLEERVKKLGKSVNEIPLFIEGRMVSLAEDLSILTDAVDTTLDAVNVEINVLKRATGSVVSSDAADGLVDFSGIEVRGSEVKQRSMGSDAEISKGDSKNQETHDEKTPKSTNKPRKGCFICVSMDHRMRDCPKREWLNALLMLEKIGLPPKPSLRGNNWVVDASHCQGCSSQFTFMNRKHHCRRCGGIFCGSCTQQRMVLRGQGDSPVRICEPCKKLEEAARFEMRYGHKNRAAKGGSKLASKKEEQISGNEDKIFSTGSTSCSNIQQITNQIEGSDIVRTLSLDQPTNTLAELESSTPEDLRQQAVVEKTKYRTLKGEGKSEEALKAFKKGKELERQAVALEISLRKNRKKALSSNDMDDIQQIKDFKERIKPSAQKSKEKDDLSSELKELGWSDLDLREAEKKPATLTLEGELSSLLREVSKKPNKEKQSVSGDRSQVIAHKKKALELKRAGNVLEAKEELKRAKILERKIEEEELLGEDDADESDDELSSLIRSMDANDEHGDLSTRYKSDINFDFNNFDDFGVDGNFEVTDEDLEDPQMASALKSLGWTEDNPHFEDSSSKRESLPIEIQSLKREALNQKRAGNNVEAMALLKKAKVREMELDSSNTRESVQETLPSNVENVNIGPKIAPKSKLAIQKELIALKKKALALRREGRLDESEEELRKAKVLEEQLEDMNKAPTVAQPSAGNRRAHASTHAPLGNGDEEEEVTDQDMHDPSYLSLLKNLGWEDEENNKIPSITLKGTKTALDYMSSPSVKQSTKSKSEIQRELLALKRKALTLRRQGETEEADEVLKNATSLEAQLQEYEEPKQREVSSENDTKSSPPIDLQENIIEHSHDSPNNVKLEKPEELVHKNEKPYIQEVNSSQETVSEPHIISPQQEILAHKRKAVTLKREGKLAEAKEELRLAKLLEKRVGEENTSQTSNTSSPDVPSEKKEAGPSSVSKPLSSRDRFKLQQESLGHKRKALKLRREGKTAEADAEFELAKALETRLEEMEPQHLKGGESDNVSVEDFLDPQLLSALQSIGLEEVRTRSPQSIEERPKPVEVNLEISSESADNTEREQLVEQIKAEKVKAVNLKRSGKQAEALDALRRAKLYEKKLQSLSQH
ncbi:hypothetical protein BUALT_Bualt14G0037000 [Buddleja alternifolia]|uniref:FYVE-type domain-containing protein n=1 Tax=Buddleja alternifolia TaxID=168488 RepID=A0AAV6WNP2_9LAMI|nr:hypothetical protein BUALT_Bualt14G0037000 [Buddleja alternifolia]